MILNSVAVMRALPYKEKLLLNYCGQFNSLM